MTQERYPISTNEQLEAALDRIAELIGSKAGTPERQELTILLAAVTEYQEAPSLRRPQGQTLH